MASKERLATLHLSVVQAVPRLIQCPVLHLHAQQFSLTHRAPHTHGYRKIAAASSQHGYMQVTALIPSLKMMHGKHFHVNGSGYSNNKNGRAKVHKIIKPLRQ